MRNALSFQFVDLQFFVHVMLTEADCHWIFALRLAHLPCFTFSQGSLYSMIRKRSHKALATVNHSAHTPSRPSPSRTSYRRGFAPPLTKSKPMIIAKPAPGRRVKIYNDKAPKSVSLLTFS